MARLLVVAGPSGVGKTTLVRALLGRRPDLMHSVSATTRRSRPGETDGVDYRFLTPERFARLERDGAFLEAADVHGHRYGTLRAPVEEALAAGRSVVLEIDVQGARQVKRAMPDAVLVFVEPPSWNALEARLSGRATETEEARTLRLRNAAAELAAVEEFEHRIVNRDLGEAAEALIRILDAADTPPEGRLRPSEGETG